MTFMTLLNSFQTVLMGISAPSPNEGMDGGLMPPVPDDYGNNAFSPFDMTYAVPHIFWLVISFSLMFLILWKVILPRLASTIEERNDRVADDLDQASAMKVEAEAAQSAYEKALADSKAKAHKIAAETRAKMDAELSEEIAEAEAGFAQRAAKAEVQIRKSTDAALAKVEEVAIEATSSIVAKLGKVSPAKAQISQAVKSVSA